MSVKFEAPTEESIQFIADNMRDEDVTEVWATARHNPREAIDISIKCSHYASVVTINGTPMVILGLSVHNVLTGSGAPWLLGTHQALGHKRKFLSETHQVVDAMLNICPNLHNFVYAENKISIRWLKWMGFSIGDPIPYGPAGELFHPFNMTR